MSLWKLYRTAQSIHRPPSKLLNIPKKQPWARYQVDAAVSRWGQFVEASLREQKQVTKNRWEPVWTPAQLLEADTGEATTTSGADEWNAFLDEAGGSW